MRNKREVGRIILISVSGMLILALSCAKDEETRPERTPTSTVPLTLESSWDYQGIRYGVPFNDPSLADTVILEVHRNIIGVDSLDGVDDLVVCNDEITADSSGEENIINHRSWLKLDDDKLKLFAYDEFATGDTAEPVLYGYPRNLLDFPLNSGKGWIVFSNIDSLESRKVVGIDYRELPYGWNYCDVVRGYITENSTGDTLRVSYEWYTDSGLMRLEYDLGIRMIRDEFGSVIDSATIYEVWDVTAFDIQP